MDLEDCYTIDVKDEHGYQYWMGDINHVTLDYALRVFDNNEFVFQNDHQLGVGSKMRLMGVNGIIRQSTKIY